MKKYFALTIFFFILLGQFKTASEAIEASKELSMELNEENISIYEKRIEEHRFKNSIEEEVYKNGYLGFLIWVTNNEYPEYDEEYKKNITEE
jgi:hypothetical protein